MPMRDLLSAERVAILSDVAERGDVLDAAARLLSQPADASPTGMAETIASSLQARERLASTAIGHGVAIPHGRIATLEESRGAFLKLTTPVAFGASDGIPVDLVLALAVPEHYIQQHLQQLAELAEHFADADFRDRLRDAGDVESLRAILLEPRPARRSIGDPV
ncbi:PTS sugar transporter subunit IIA [Lysobacter korlensis]|uniref:PTS sugar transporter subunit IIA n=1 Tax=Lysobacter korlensis TaxID=553636 RepID=A0ABV6RS79_9GAMM